MNKIAKIHTCDSSCKGRNVNTVKCFLCNVSCFTKCFGIEQALQIKVNSPDSSIRFICDTCRNAKKSNRLSTTASAPPASTPHTSTPPAITSSTPAPHKTPGGSTNQDMIQINENIKAILDLLSARAPSVKPIVSDRDTDEQQQPSSNTSIDNMYKLILKLDDKVNKLHTNDNEIKSIQNIHCAIDKKFTDFTSNLKKLTAPDNDLFDNSKITNWPMHNDSLNETSNGLAGRPSMIIKQSVDDDILEILKNNDITTWNTLDVILKKIIEQNSKLDTILSKDNGISRHSDHVSPVIEAIRNTANSSFSLNVTDLPTYSRDNSSHSQAGLTSNEFYEVSLPVNETDGFSNSFLVTELNKADNTNNLNSNSNDHVVNPSTFTSSPNEDQTLSAVMPSDTPQQQQPLYEFHLSNLSKSTTENMIHDHLVKSGITDLSHVKLTCLKPRNRDLSMISYISFKIDTDESIASIISKPGFWPHGCNFKKFTQRPKSTASFLGNSSNNFLSHRPTNHVIR